ncbi:uncharacterized protein LOC131930344 [Physella acuta]|uniref:uncharacterized protein LOC131930344 n=1 Tax=Physella acuta TaxID=109671 RepID=UPI0027DCF570|nr:uncharacterized protein LOC131930344 [Physella acuta]XP_059142762.1 uncharacterized protein LOC131930344 [Physella acuta]XP_059142763.1 uncharacterized protein LOC131930344 [Physella acuta]XP_059142764.1 uncharacterized protein LOC131930344 [Physella acuta]
MVSLHLLCLLLIVCSTQGAGVSAHLIDKRPDCFKSCSHDVECTIKISDTMCSYVDVHDQAKGGDTNIAGRIWNLTMKTSTDEKYRYVDLEWGAPDDGSYNFLTGFLLSISTVNLDSDKFLTPQLECFNLDLGNWTAPHRQLLSTRSYGAQFFFNCLRLSRNISREVTVIMHSQPISEKLPKLVQKSFKVPSALEDQYTTYFDHKQIGLLHVIIHKHKKLTDQFQAVLHERQYPSIVRFKQILPLVRFYVI